MPLNTPNKPNSLNIKAINPQNSLPYIIHFVLCPVGAGDGLKKATETKICTFLGRISYPLYVVHLPIVFVQMSWVAQHPQAPLGAHIMTALFAVLISIATAYAALKLYDEPLRKRLTNRFLSKS